MQACEVDAAPDAPWRCPDNCAFFEKRLISHVGWETGTLKTPHAPAEPEVLDPEAEAALADAEAIVNEIVPELNAELEREERRGRKRRRRRRK